MRVPRRVVKVLHADGDALRDGIAVIQDESSRSTPEFSAEVETAAARAAAPAPAARARPQRHPARDHRPRRRRRTSTRRCTSSATATGYVVHYAIADVAAFVGAGRPRRRGGAPARGDAVRRRHEGAAAPAGDLRGLGVAAARRQPAGAAVDHQGRRGGEGTDVHVERALVRSRAKLDYEAVAEGLDAGDGRRAGRPARRGRGAAQARGRRPAAGSSLPLPEQEIDIDGGPLDARLPAHAAGGGVERADLAAHRDGRRVADGLRAGRVCCARCRRRTRATYSALHRTGQGAGHRVARRASPTPTSSARWIPTCRAHAAMVVACTRLLRGAGYVALRRRACPSSPSTRRWPRSTPTSPRRCAGSSTATPARSASRCAPGPRCPRGCWSALAELPATMQSSGSARTATSAPSSTWWRRPCCTPHVGETFAGVVVELEEKDPTRGDIVVREPAVGGPGPVRLGPAARRRRRGHPGRGGHPHPYRPLRAVSRSPGGALDWRRMSRPGGRGGVTRRGRSGLHRARWWATPTRGDPRDSATENRPPPPPRRGGKGETVV